MPDKFRSIKAFRQFEQRSLQFERRSLGVEVEDRTAVQYGGRGEEVSPLRVLAAVKKHPRGVSRRDLAADLSAPLPVVEEALLHLLKEDLVRLQSGATPDDERILP